MNWFRFYSEALDDPKVQRLPGDLFKAWVNLLCLANKGRIRGVLPSTADMAFALRLDERQVDGIVDRLIAAELLEHNAFGDLVPHGWEGRQAASDDGAARKRAQRAKTEHAPDTDPDPSGVCSVPRPETRNGTSTETYPVTRPVLEKNRIDQIRLDESTIPPTPQPEPLPLVDAAAHAARADGSAPQGKKPRRAAQEVPKPSAGWDFPLLWQLVTDQQGYKPTWDYGRETKAVKHLLTACPGAQPADFARFLAYVGTCWPFCEEPTRQPTFSEGAKHFGAWYTGGQPERSPAPEKQRSRYESPSERTAREWRESIGSIESLGFNQDRDYQEPPALPDGPARPRVIDLDGRRVGGNVGRDPDGLAGTRVPGGAAWATG